MNTEITKYSDDAPRGWIFYDAACRTCVRGQSLTGRLFESRGYRWLPLQTPGAAERLGVSELAVEIRMHLLLPDGRVLTNADAFGLLCRSVWWLWPLGAILLVPGFREIGHATYDWFARNRYAFGGACEINFGTAIETPATPREALAFQARKQKSFITSAATILPLLLLPAFVLALHRHFAAWIFMWTLAFALFAGCKWLTYSIVISRNRSPGWRRRLAYLFAWPGMNAAEFFSKTGVTKPTASDWLSATANILSGAVLLWIVTRRIVPLHPLAGGWMGMVGIVFILHFGLFKLIALVWRANGICATPLMRAPIASKSLGEFWGRRWNTGFHDLANRFAFAPLRKIIGTVPATLAVFALSGLVHELVISIPARGGFGFPTIYFLLQGLGVVGEHTRIGRRIGLGRGARGRIFTIAITAIPAPLLFHPPFIHNVILPMLNAIGAT